MITEALQQLYGNRVPIHTGGSVLYSPNGGGIKYHRFTCPITGRKIDTRGNWHE